LPAVPQIRNLDSTYSMVYTATILARFRLIFSLELAVLRVLTSIGIFPGRTKPN